MLETLENIMLVPILTKTAKASNLYNEIIDNYSNYEIYTSGNISEWNKPVLHLWIKVKLKLVKPKIY